MTAWVIGTVLLLVVVVVAFHDIFIYPTDVRKECDTNARQSITKVYEQQFDARYPALVRAYNTYYESCLHQHGM